MLQAAMCPSGVGGSTVVRVGFTASRKVGNAVVRNRAKRRLRAAAAEILARDGRLGTDYVLIARAGTGERRYGDLLGDLASALRQVTRQADRDRADRDRAARDRKDQPGRGPRAARPPGRERGGEPRPGRVEEGRDDG
jgi:ribonuclease P protein component